MSFAIIKITFLLKIIMVIIMKNKLFLDVADSFLQKGDIKLDKKKKDEIEINYFEVDKNNGKRLKKEEGKYYTINYTLDVLNKYPNNLKKEILRVIKSFKKPIKNYKTTLVVGLGNSSVLCDSLGPETTNKIIATNHYTDFLTIPKVALFVPEVISKTGISSYALIKMLVSSLKPSLIIVIDSLATSNPKRLNKCIEISDTGIIPGGAIKTNKKISYKTFNIPIIAIGVPLVIEVKKRMYTSIDAKDIIEKLSDIIASSLNDLFLK